MTPLSISNREDQLIWHYEAKGVYSGKSGNRITFKREDSKRRASINALPSSGIFARRKVIADPSCCRCGASFESLSHALLSCDTSKAAWKEAGFWDVVKQGVNGSMADLFVAIFWNLLRDL
ncbi:hypothetical protein TorRG33x02_093050 [Trema orientale]|uniref:Reverse transcriptase zinc-binding domain-containing protein n=1 Tax=Trema orientale TaxID=63057 RepID=A0A2P5FAI1_TREOI|nr:hypothetical protein TorRG33x02_093050 [Trema orientale]